DLHLHDPGDRRGRACVERRAVGRPPSRRPRAHVAAGERAHGRRRFADLDAGQRQRRGRGLRHLPRPRARPRRPPHHAHRYALAPDATTRRRGQALNGAGHLAAAGPPPRVRLGGPAPAGPPGASLVASATDPSTVEREWSPATDDTGVTGYVVYEDGIPTATA